MTILSKAMIFAPCLALVTLRPALAEQPAKGAPPAPPAAVSTADLAKAKALFDAGGRAYDAGDFSSALQAFEQAYSIAPRDGILFSIAQANRRLYTTTNDRSYLERSIQLYKQYLVAVQSGGRRAEATRALGDLEVLLGKPTEPSASPPPMAGKTKKTLLAVDSPTAGCLISIDGSPPKPPQVTSEVSSGRHTVKLVAEGFEDKEVTVQAIEGELVPLSYELVEKPGRVSIEKADGADVSIDGRFVGSAPFSRPLDLPSGSHFIAVSRAGHEPWGRDIELERGRTKTLAPELSSTTQRRVSYGFFIAGGASLVASGVVFGVSLARESAAKSTLDDLKSASITPAQQAAYERAKSDRDNLRTAGAALAGAGAAMGVVGLLLYTLDTPRPLAAPASARTKATPKPDERTEHAPVDLSIVPVIGPSVNGATMIGSF